MTSNAVFVDAGCAWLSNSASRSSTRWTTSRPMSCRGGVTARSPPRPVRRLPRQVVPLPGVCADPHWGDDRSSSDEAALISHCSAPFTSHVSSRSAATDAFRGSGWDRPGCAVTFDRQVRGVLGRPVAEILADEDEAASSAKEPVSSSVSPFRPPIWRSRGSSSPRASARASTDAIVGDAAGEMAGVDRSHVEVVRASARAAYAVGAVARERSVEVEA